MNSELGHGATVAALLPITDDPAETVEKAAPAPAQGTGHTILLVEDDDGLRALTERILYRNGYTVFSAATAAEARPMRVTIRVDDGQPMRRRARSVLIANVGRLQGGVRLLSKAEPDDGVLNIAVLTPCTLRNWAALGWGSCGAATGCRRWRCSAAPRSR